uniref:Cytochrome P450 n=1 Tax=Arcella intermedia TaxID=1963864 RepID=A0A6B2L3G3_9EUKA
MGLIVVYLLYRLSVRKGSKYPPSVKALWVPALGHVLGFGGDPVAFLMKQRKLVGDLFSFELFGRDVVFFGDTECYEAFYKAPATILSAAEAYKFTIPAFGKGVVYDMPHDKFMEQRRMIHNTLTVNNFKTFVGIMEEETEGYLKETWTKPTDKIDFYKAVSDIVMRTSTRCLQGEQVRAVINDGYVGWMADIDHSLSVFSFFFPNLPLPTFNKRNLARAKIGEIFKKILDHREKNGYTNNDFIEVMRNKTYAYDGTKMNKEEIAGLSVALMLAGYHTSNVTSSWVAIHMLSHPEVHEAVLKEQEAVVQGQKLDFEKIRSLEVLDSCISESLRLRPPIILIFRKVMQDFTVKNFVIPKGSLVCISPATRHRDPDFYKNADSYEPSRWRNEETKRDTNDYSYIPFSTGEHYCVGEKFAVLQIKTILSVIFKEYNLKLIGSEKDYPVDNSTMLAAPIKPVMVQYTKK